MISLHSLRIRVLKIRKNLDPKLHCFLTALRWAISLLKPITGFAKINRRVNCTVNYMIKQVSTVQSGSFART